RRHHPGLAAGHRLVTHGAELVRGDPVAHAGLGLADRWLPVVCGAGARSLAGRGGARSRQCRDCASRPMMRDPMTRDSMTRDSVTRDLAGLSPGLLTRYLAVFLLLNAFAFNGLLWLVSPEPYKETVLQHTYDVLRGRGCDDSWGIMSVSLEYAQEQHDKP